MRVLLCAGCCLGRMGRGAVPEPFRDPLKGGRKGSGPPLAASWPGGMLLATRTGWLRCRDMSARVLTCDLLPPEDVVHHWRAGGG
jgi:hypothetical protein